MHPQTEVIRIRDLHLELRKGNARFSLSIPSFSAFQGEIIAVVGPSGCGKSTFLDVLGLVLSPESAAEFSFCFPDADCYDLKHSPRDDIVLSRLRRRHIGYVLQSGGLLPYLTVAKNILLPLALEGMGRSAVTTARALGIEDQLDKKPGALSGGQRQRAAIARALIHDPDIILADEPTAAVDHSSARAILTIFRLLATQRKTLVILATHDRKLAKNFADVIIEFEPSQNGPGSVLYTVENELMP